MRIPTIFAAALAAFVALGASSAWAGSVHFENKAGTELKFYTQGVTRSGSVTQWKLWHLHSHRKLTVRCEGCVSFNFEIRTDKKHPAKYSLDLDHTYKLNYNRHKHKWDLFQ